MITSHRVGAGTPTRILCKSSRYFVTAWPSPQAPVALMTVITGISRGRSELYSRALACLMKGKPSFSGALAEETRKGRTPRFLEAVVTLCLYLLQHRVSLDYRTLLAYPGVVSGSSVPFSLFTVCFNHVPTLLTHCLQYETWDYFFSLFKNHGTIQVLWCQETKAHCIDPILLFSTGPQPMEWCHSHVGWVFHLFEYHLDKSSQAYPDVCLLSDSRSCHIDNINYHGYRGSRVIGTIDRTREMRQGPQDLSPAQGTTGN